MGEPSKDCAAADAQKKQSKKKVAINGAKQYQLHIEFPKLAPYNIGETATLAGRTVAIFEEFYPYCVAGKRSTQVCRCRGG